MGDPLRVTRITFFAHGLACLEHAVTVKDDTKHILSIKPSSMADLLKTLTIHPGKCGRVKSVTYDAPPSRDDRSQPVKTDSIFMRFTENQGNSHHVIVDVVKEHIGSPMTVFHEKGSVTGRIMGTQTLDSSGNHLHNDAVVLLQDDGLMVPVLFSRVQGMRFNGRKGEDVAARFQRAAERGNIGVTITTEGEGERKLTVRYAIEAPVYKVTYRVILLDEKDLYLQAWAIVDNPSDERLDDVEVVIIAGLPMSFRHDVYEARYISRPVEPVPKQAGFAGAVGGAAKMPPFLQLGDASGGNFGLFGSPGEPASQCFGAAISGNASLFGAPKELGSQVDGGKVQPGGEAIQQVNREQATISRWNDTAEASAIGSVHQYRIPGRVTIPPRESALLPLIMATIPGGQVDLYVHHMRATNTLRAVKIENNTTAPFEKGPVAVYDGDTLVGEGMLPICQPGANMLMPYSVNLECKVKKRGTDRKGGSVTESYASSGKFYFKRYYEKVTIYDFSEQGKRLEVVVVHDRLLGHDSPSAELLPTKLLKDDTANRTKIIAEKEKERVSHFRITLEPGVKASLRVTETQLVTSKYDISTMFDYGILTSFTHETGVGKEVLERMKLLAATKEELSKVELEINQLKNNGREVEATQRRYRENVMALSGGQGRLKDSGLVTEYAQRIRESEVKIEELMLKIKEKEGKVTELKDKFARIVAEFENNVLAKKTEGGKGSSST